MSKKLSQAELQKIWDTSLLACWKSDVSGNAIVSVSIKARELDKRHDWDTVK